MRNSEYSKNTDRIKEIYVSGNTAAEIEKEEESQKAVRRALIEEQRREGLKRQAQKRAQKRERAFAYALAASACALVLGVMVLLLSSVITYNSLTKEISTLTAELETLVEENDSIEYDIDSSVDLSYVISVATTQLGMVRSTSSQVVTYSDPDSEYINQVADIPSN